MSSMKWIAGFLGWVSGGPIGAIVGYLLGSAADYGIDAIKTASSGQQVPPSGGARNSFNTGQRNSFLVSLLVLSSAVIRSDGHLLQSELDYVRQFVRRNFGDYAVEDAMRILADINSKEINIYQVGAQIADNMNYSQRLQLLHYLSELANADGDVCQSEKDVLESIASALRINRDDASSVIAMFYHSNDSAYVVLEVRPDASDDEVKAAYRRMAMKYHPDKVASLGPEVQKSAEEKFRRIQEAYESIKKQRGLN